MLFAGIDWASEEHAVAVHDDVGKSIAAFMVEHSAEGLDKLVADNVAGTYEELKGRGVEFVQPPKKEHWGEHAIFRDSEGNRVLFAKT